MYDFEFVRPKNLSDAKSALTSGDAQVLAGGQTLLTTMKQRLASPDRLVSLSAIEELQGIERTRGTIRVGGMTPHAVVAKDLATDYPALASLASRIGDPAVRTRGTIGGSLANNDPAACYPAAVLASGATVVTDRRSISADDFFDGLFTTALDEGELITAVEFPVPGSASYQKFVQPASRFAMVGVFVARFADAVRVAITGASSDGVFRWTDAENRLTSDFSSNALDGADLGSVEMLSDIHADADYRQNLVRVLTERAVASIA
ncbi:MAG: xanthine dehydrogenase family protein subunit M [Pseudomonadota bacterium]